MYFLFQCTYYKSSGSGVYFKEQLEYSQVKVRAKGDWKGRVTVPAMNSRVGLVAVLCVSQKSTDYQMGQ